MTSKTYDYEVAVRAEAILGEGPTWDPAHNRLIWLDILGARLREDADRLSRGGARRLERLAGGRIDPLAGDVVLERLRPDRHGGRDSSAADRETDRAARCI